jgi:NDP-sugar pyrophosphorylase family protein
MPVGEMPILEIVIRQLSYFGIQRITIAIGHLGELIIAYFGDGSRYGVQIDYSREHAPLGTAGPLSLIENLDETFLVMNGDLLTTIDFQALLRRHKESGAIATISAYAYETKIDLGILEIDGDNRITGYLEKPTYTNRVSMGIYAFEPEVLGFVEKGVRFDLPELILRMVNAKKEVRASVFDGFWLDIGRPADYAYVTESYGKLLPMLLHQSTSKQVPDDRELHNY